MVEGYLNLVRLEHGATAVRIESCRLDQIVIEACRLLRPQFQEKRIQLKGIEELAKDRWVEGDEGLLRQVFLPPEQCPQVQSFEDRGKRDTCF